MASYATNSDAVVAERIDAAASEAMAIPLARLVIAAALVVAPWAFGAVESWAWIGIGMAACAALLLWGWGSVEQRTLTFVWSPLYVPLALFFGLAVIQYAFRLTLDTSETRQALVLLATDLALFFLTVQLFSTASAATWRSFGLATLILAGSLGLFAILQFAAGEQRIYGEVNTPGNLLFGPYVNPNHFAGLMEMLVPVAVLYLAERHGRRSISLVAWLGVGAAVGVASLLLSGSRGGLLALITEIVVAIPVLRSSGRRAGGRGLAITVAATVFASVMLFTWVDPGIVSQKLSLIGSADRQSAWFEWADFRKTVALDSLRIVAAHPVSGVGLGNFETAYPRYQSFPSDLWIDYAHNDYVQAFAETGLLGALLIVASLAIFIRLAFGANPLQSPSPGRWIRLGAALGCCGMLVHSFFDFNLHLPANAAWFAVLAGLATCDLGKEAELE